MKDSLYENFHGGTGMVLLNAVYWKDPVFNNTQIRLFTYNYLIQNCLHCGISSANMTSSVTNIIV